MHCVRTSNKIEIMNLRISFICVHVELLLIGTFLLLVWDVNAFPKFPIADARNARSFRRKKSLWKETITMSISKVSSHIIKRHFLVQLSFSFASVTRLRGIMNAILLNFPQVISILLLLFCARSYAVVLSRKWRW